MRLTALLARLLAASAAIVLTAAAPSPRGLIIDDVTVVDTATGRLTPHRAVVIDGGRIVRIAAAGSRAADARRIDGTGKFVVPGFLDMHAHPLSWGDTPGALRLMLAEGVTGYRQMNGSPEMLAQRRAGAFDLPDSPELLALSGSLLAGPLAPTPEAAIAEVRRQKTQGADFIKFIDEPGPAFFAALAEATAQGLPLAGHLPPVIDVREASRHGMASIEHLGPREAVLLGCSTRESELRAAVAAAPRGPAGPPPPGAMERTLANPIAATPAAAILSYGTVLDTYDAARCTDLARTFVANATWQVPTLIRLRTMEFGDDPAYRHDPNLRYAPRATRELWESVATQFERGATPASRAALARLFAAQLALVKLFDTNGVPMMAGSDLGGGWVLPGYGLHQEFDLLAQAGVSPLHVLQMTTLDGARFLHREATMGSVAAGRNADLVLLDGNPVASVANLHRIAGVVRAGRYYTPADLDALKAATAAGSAQQ